jgi:acyl-homoserine lactone acylase PvdQ
VNIFMETHPKEVPLEFKLARIRPESWTITDPLAVVYLMVWDTPASLQTEIVTRMLMEKLGWNRARGIFPRNVNRDAESILPVVTLCVPLPGGIGRDPRVLRCIEARHQQPELLARPAKPGGRG